MYGKQFVCEYKDCKTTDLAPYRCSYCRKQLCMDHKPIYDHECEQLNVNIKKKKIPVKIKKCIKCDNDGIYVCGKCNTNVCVTHRRHDKHTTINKIPKISNPSSPCNILWQENKYEVNECCIIC